MAIFRPLVLLGNNTVGELPSGDNVAGQFVLDFIADPASNSNADLYTTITALLAEMRDKGMMLVEEAVLPENVIAPVVTGSNTTPTMLSCDLGTWINSPTSYARQWQLDGVDIPGQTGTNINIGVGEIGDYRCGVTATNAAGTTAPTYSNVITVADEAGGEPGFIGWQGPADDVTPLSDNRVWVYKVVLTETAVLDEFFIYKQTGAGGPEVKGLIFTDNAGEPDELVASTAMVTCPAGPTWFSIPITGTLPPGTYWIGLVTGGVYTPVGATSSRAGEEIKRAEGYPYPGWNTDWPGTAGTVSPRSLAIYVTYNSSP